MPSLICSTCSIGPGRCGGSRPQASKVRSAAAPSPFLFSDFHSGARELGHQLDLRGPALRLPADVDISFCGLLFADSGGRWSSADRAPMLMSASPVRGRRGFDAGERSGATGSSTRLPNSAAITLALRRALPPTFRLVRSWSLSLGAWVPTNPARRILASAARCCSTCSGRLSGSPAAPSPNSILVIFRLEATMKLGRSERTTMRPLWSYRVDAANTLIESRVDSR